MDCGTIQTLRKTFRGLAAGPYLTGFAPCRHHVYNVDCRHPNAYVRAAKPSELPAVTDVLTRAFLDDPTMCYYGSAPALVKDPANPTPSEEKTIRALRVFQGAMARVPWLVGGNVDVVVIPSEPEGSTSEANKGKEASKEQIVAVALWLPPGTTLDLKLSTLLRAGIHKVAFTWGFNGVMRLIGDYTPAVEAVLTREFSARKLDRLDTWHVFAVAVDLDHQGSEGFSRASPTPIHLVASKPKNRDIYEHFGFQLIETLTVGVGEVGANGLRAQGEAATGLPEFVMIKWTS